MKIIDMLNENISKNYEKEQINFIGSIQRMAEAIIEGIKRGGTLSEIPRIIIPPSAREPEFLSKIQSVIKFVSDELEIVINEDCTCTIRVIGFRSLQIKEKSDKDLELEKESIKKKIMELQRQTNQIVNSLQDEYLILDREVTRRCENRLINGSVDDCIDSLLDDPE
jgi:hypothetical protein